MKNNIKTTLIIGLFCLVGYSQQLPNISPPPPDIHSLYKFSEIPVSNTTGVPNINVPIHEIKLKGFTLPIAINYHSSGIIIDEVASDIGLGWSISAGGMISQIPMGEPDVGNSPPFPQNDVLDSSYPQPTLSTNPNEEYYLLKQLSFENSIQNGVDTQPDAYMFNVGNLSGKFFFDLAGNAHTIPKSDIKVITNNNGIAYTIIDEKGNKYFFQTMASNLNYNDLIYSSNGIGGSSYSENFSFYITKIETYNNEKIEFEYNTISYKYRNPDFLKRSKRKFDNTGLSECTSLLSVPDINNSNSWVGFELENNESYSNYVEVNIGKTLSKTLNPQGIKKRKRESQ